MGFNDRGKLSKSPIVVYHPMRIPYHSLLRKVGWVLTIGENTIKAYCCVPPHENIVSQYAGNAEKGGVISIGTLPGGIAYPCPLPPHAIYCGIEKGGVGFNDRGKRSRGLSSRTTP